MTETTWNGFRRIDFDFEGRNAILIFPETPNENKNWLLKTVYFDAFPEFEIDMLKRGWHLVYLENVTRWCVESDLDTKKALVEYLHKEYGLYPKCVPVGMSCGGLMGVKFAAKYPECVSCLYLDAPALNFLSCPAGLGASEHNFMDEFTEALGLTLVDLLNYREHPIDKKEALLKNNIPIIMVYGDADEVVPYAENGAILEKYYRDNGGIMETYGKPGCKHHPHGLENREPIINFVEKHSK